MNSPKKLKELPGFDDALARAIDDKREYLFCYDFEEAGNAVIPGITRVGLSMLEQVALLIGMDRMNREYERKQRRQGLRLVPPPRPVAANDCEAVQ